MESFRSGLEESDIIQASLGGLPEQELFSFLYAYCPDIRKLFGECDSLASLKSYIATFLANRYIAIKGQIQSGKTAFMICASMMTLMTGLDVVIILRNSNSDLHQIHSRLAAFQQQILNTFATTFSVTTSKKPKPSTDPQIVLALANGISLEKVLSVLQKNYLLVVDEADHVDSGTQTRKAVVLPMLKDQAHCVLGVSATVMDLLGKESMLPKDLILLSPPHDYKGIPYILEQMTEFIPPGSVYSSKVDSDLLENDPYLLDWVDELIVNPPGVLPNGSLHPNIALITICDTVDPCLKAREAIISRFGDRVLVIDHHANGISLRHDGMEYDTTDSISEVLQDLKHNHSPEIPILIFAGDIAGRGVSYVSQDYGWHLTHQRLIVSKSCSEPELMQKIRLCGIYRDSLPLKLVTTEEIAKDLRKAYLKQEELVDKVRVVATSFEGQCRDYFKEIPFEKEKMSGRQITKDPKAKPDLQLVEYAVGWKYERDEKREMDEEAEYPKKEFERLVNKMFPKWAADGGMTNISRFMHELEVDKKYTHSEMVELCEETGISKKNLKNLTLVSSGKSNGYGQILEVVDGKYQIYSCLRAAHQHWFTAMGM